jgi:hypothetical protein
VVKKNMALHIMQLSDLHNLLLFQQKVSKPMQQIKLTASDIKFWGIQQISQLAS